MAGEQTVQWSPEHKQSLYERDYWTADDPAAQYMQSRLSQLGQQAQRYGQQVKSEVSQQTGGQGAGTIGQFAQAIRADQPYAMQKAELEQGDISRRWGAEQSQIGRQQEYNQMQLQKALAEQQARMSKWSERKNRQASGSSAMQGMMSGMGSGAASYFLS